MDEKGGVMGRGIIRKRRNGRTRKRAFHSAKEKEESKQDDGI